MKKLAFLLVFLVFNSFISLTSHAQFLPDAEVNTLKTIATKLNSRYWNGLTNASCSQGSGLNATFGSNTFSNLTCDCTFKNNTVCHITIIQLKSLNLTGVFPAEFADLPQLRELDLSLNYINGSLPESLARIPLSILSLLGNRISGSIPSKFGDISTLEELILEDNKLGGPLPRSLGKLTRLRRLLLSANNFTGIIPETFGQLKNITDFRIDGSSLSGKIAAHIGNWKNLTRLDLQGTSMEGPIPSTISLLTNLKELRISDLKGLGSSFPDLQAMEDLRILILRRCKLTGGIPAYLGQLTKLKTLDLSFNRLSGTIPQTLQSLTNLDNMFLIDNLISGTIHDWILSSKQNFDVSHNNFNTSSQLGCQQSNVNLESSFSSSKSNLITWCLRKDLPCPGEARHHSLHINCGGGTMRNEGNEYEEDLNTAGISNFVSSGTKWAYSSTGVFMGNANAPYRATNTFALNVTGADYYQTARLSPSSLKYYGLCMQKGSYRVQLHFAEIMYSDDRTFSSLGRRIFDVSIQGNVVLKDFNIMEEAKGVGKGITMNFNDIDVNGTTLEIHLYWTGQGTTAIPNRGVYGPLISAITVTPNFSVDTGGLSARVIAGIVVASVVFIILILIVLRLKGCLGGKDLEDKGKITT